MMKGFSVAEAYIRASTIARQTACCVDENGLLLGMSTPLKVLLELSSSEKPAKIFEFEPSMSLFAWRDLWGQLKTKQEVIIQMTLLKTTNEIIELGAKAVLSSQGEEEFCFLVFDIQGPSITTETSAVMSESMMSYTINNTDEMIFWIDEPGNLFYVNKKVLEKTGYTPEDVLTLKAWDFSEEVKSAEEWASFFELVKSENRYQVETEQYRKDGGINYVDTISTFMDYAGKEYIFSIVIDVTEKKAQQRELEARKQELEHLSAELENERNYLQQEIISVHNFNDIITNDENYKHVLNQMQQVAGTDATVLVLGETGTGKELIARAIHNLSKRRNKPMVKVNCAALPTNLIESELFGHEKGAFTGAFKQKIGRFELADKGTIFLDEIGEMPLDLQSKLLRALQEGEFERLGSTKTIKVDVRVIAATNRKLEEMIADGKFREDLYYRLNVFPIHNIPLRQRKGDIPLLVNFFVKKYCKKFGRSHLKVTQASLKRLMHYEFPGNIRELENLIERAIILSTGDKNTLNLNAALPDLAVQENKLNTSFLSLEEIQRNHILEALKRTHWKVTGKQSAAELLQMNGKTLASKIKKLNIERDSRLL